MPNLARFKNLTLKAVINLIIQCSGKRPVLLIDEYVKFYNSTSSEERKKIRTIEDNMLKDVIDVFELPSVWTTFDISLYTLREKKTLSSRPIIWIPIRPIEETNLQKIPLLEQFSNNTTVKILYRLCGGHPRSLEFLTEEIQLLISKSDYGIDQQNKTLEKSYPIILGALIHHYNQWGYDKLLQAAEYVELLFKLFNKQKVYFDHLVLPNAQSSSTYQDLVAHAFMLNSFVDTRTPQLPVINLLRLAIGIKHLHGYGAGTVPEGYKNFVDILHEFQKVIVMDPTNPPEDFEIFHLLFDVLRITILALKATRMEFGPANNSTTIPLEKFYPEATVHPECKKKIMFQVLPEFTTLPGSIHQRKETQFSAKLINFQDIKEENFCKFYLCKTNNPGFDSFFLRKAEDGTPLLFLIECKYSAENTKKLRRMEILDKIDKASKECKKCGWEGENVIFVIAAMRVVNKNAHIFEKETYFTVVILDNAALYNLYGGSNSFGRLFRIEEPHSAKTLSPRNAPRSKKMAEP